MTTYISGDVGVSKVQDGVIVQADLATAILPIGVGQTWKTRSIVSGQSYTNSAGRPIMLLANAVSQANITLTIGGFTLPTQYSATGDSCMNTYVIPDGAVYSVTIIISAGSAAFAELS